MQSVELKHYPTLNECDRMSRNVTVGQMVGPRPLVKFGDCDRVSRSVTDGRTDGAKRVHYIVMGNLRLQPCNGDAALAARTVQSQSVLQIALSHGRFGSKQSHLVTNGSEKHSCERNTRQDTAYTYDLD